jgi:hypothetical protein
MKFNDVKNITNNAYKNNQIHVYSYYFYCVTGYVIWRWLIISITFWICSNVLDITVLFHVSTGDRNSLVFYTHICRKHLSQLTNYLLHCQECPKQYGAQTCTIFSTRFKEHINAMRNKNSTSSNYAQLKLEMDHTLYIKENTMELRYITHIKGNNEYHRKIPHRKSKQTQFTLQQQHRPLPIFLFSSQ